jgi:DNA invertase Pin-like site-specific DNA recombinase
MYVLRICATVRPMTAAGAYIRVSAAKEGGQSAEEQRAAIEAQAKADGAVLVAEEVEENVSGGKAARLRKLETLVQAAEDGELSTIYVLDFSRLTREHPYRAMEPLARLLDVGGRVVGIHDGFDSSTEQGAQTAGLLAGQAYAYRQTTRKRWEAAKERAIRDGRVVGRAPVGYVRDEDGRLTPDPKAGPAITAAFDMRAGGASLREVADFLEGSGVRSSPSAQAWAWQSVKDMLTRRVYLGELRLGEFVNLKAHEPLTDLPTWQAAQGPPPRSRRPKTGGDLLTGLVRCASCGYSMTATTRSDGVRIYRCVAGRRGGKCPAAAFIRADAADDHARMALALIAGATEVERPKADAPDVDGLRAVLDAAQRRLEQAQADDVQEALGHDAWVAMLAGRRRAVDEAAATLGAAEAELRRRGDLVDVSTVLQEFDTGTLQERREVLARLIDLFAVMRDKEVLVYPRGTAPGDLPTQGRASGGLHPLPDAGFEGFSLLPVARRRRKLGEANP